MNNTHVASPLLEEVVRTPIVFENQETGLKLAGIMFRPFGHKKEDKLPGVIVAGPMYAVKELTQSLHAQYIAKLGYITMVFDYSYIGSSEGQPRGLEDPDMKASDIRSAISYMRTIEDVDAERIAGVGICGSGAYMAYGATTDSRMKALVSILPFTLMDTVVTESEESLLKKKEAYERGEATPELLALIQEGSEGAAYYHNVKRGASANYVDAVSWSQLLWQRFHPIDIANNIKQPYLVITGEKAFTREGAEKMYENATGPKKLHITKEAGHFDMYDLEPYVSENIEQIRLFLKEYL